MFSDFFGGSLRTLLECRNQTDITPERREGEAGAAEAARAGVPRPRPRPPPAPGGLPQQGGAGRGPGRPQQYCPQDEVQLPLTQPYILNLLLPRGCRDQLSLHRKQTHGVCLQLHNLPSS